MKDKLLPTLSILHAELEGWSSSIEEALADNDTGEVRNVRQAKAHAMPLLDQIIEHFQGMKTDLEKSWKQFHKNHGE